MGSAEPLRVLVVEDDRDQAELIRRVLTRHHPPFDVTVVRDGPASLAALAARRYTIVLLDYSLPGMNGLDVLAEIRSLGVPVVMITGQGNERLAVAAMNAGAIDYVIKTSGYVATLPTVLHKALKQHELAAENARLYEESRRRLRESELLLDELHATQERLVRGETLRALGELASGTAHHLNNLLAVVIARVDMLRMKPLDPEVRRPLEIVGRVARDGAEVVRRIQQFARTKQLEDLAPVDLNELARDVIELTTARWRDAARVEGVAIEVAHEPGCIPLVGGHPASLREVITNLVLNAVDALPRGGRITIKTRAAGDDVWLSVTDDGVGMPPEVARRAREPFFTTKGPKSTGLGLSVNHSIVCRHGGEMTIESAPGRGTTVTIRLPAGAPVPTAPPTAPSAGVEALRVLLIDDEQEVRETLAELLAIDGHVVTQAVGGEEGLAQLERGPLPDVVLSDLGMPGMTGADVAAAVKRRWPELPVGVITGWGIGAPAERQQLAMVDFVLSKPVSLDDLRRSLGRIGKAAHSPTVAGQGA